MNYVVRAFKPSEEQYVADLHERLYSGEYAWGPSFIDYARKIALEFPKRRSPDTDELWVATDERDRPVGSNMLCATDDPKVGQLRLFAVEETCRRQGIGGKLMGALLEKGRSVGFERLVLWTAAPLEAAIRQYERIGFRVVETAENTSWRTDGGSVMEIKMELTL